MFIFPGRKIVALALCAVLAFSMVFCSAPFLGQAATADVIIDVANQLQGVYYWLGQDLPGKDKVADAKDGLKDLTKEEIINLLWPPNDQTHLSLSNIVPSKYQTETIAKDKIGQLLHDAAKLTYQTDLTGVLKSFYDISENRETVETLLPGVSLEQLYGFFNLAQTEGVKNSIPQDDWKDILKSKDYSDIRGILEQWLSKALSYAAGEYNDIYTKLRDIGWTVNDLAQAENAIARQVDPQYQAEIALLKAYVRSKAHFSGTTSSPGNKETIKITAGNSVSGKILVLDKDVTRDLKYSSNNQNVTFADNNGTLTISAASGSGGQTAEITAYYENKDTDWVYKGIVNISAPSTGGPGAGPTTPPSAEKLVQDIQEKLESGKTTPEQAAKDLAEHLKGLAPEKITEELKTRVQNLVKAIVEKAGTVAVSTEQITMTDSSATVTVGTEAIAAALANLENVFKTLKEALEKAKITDIPLVKQVVLTVPPEAAARPEVVVQIPAQALTDLSNAGAALVVRPSDAVAIIFPVIQAQSAALGMLVADAGSAWLDNLAGSAATPTVQVKTRTLDRQETARLTAGLPATAAEQMTLAGKIVEVDITTAAGKYTKPVRLLLNYDPAKVKDAELLGAYTYDETGGNWRYLDGKIDAVNKAVDVQWAGLGRYAALEYNRTFADAVSHWARREIKVMAARHLVAGVSRENFAPDRQITRAEFAVILARMMNLTADPAGAERFVDIPAGAWYRGMVGAAAKAGLVAGTSQNTFAPDELITREQMAAMIARLLTKQKGLTITEAEANNILTSYQDAAAVSAWARLSVALMVKESIMKGREAATFVPHGESTRAEATVVLYRVLQNI